LKFTISGTAEGFAFLLEIEGWAGRDTGRTKKQRNTNRAPENVKEYSGDQQLFAFRTKDSPGQIGLRSDIYS